MELKCFPLGITECLFVFTCANPSRYTHVDSNAIDCVAACLAPSVCAGQRANTADSCEARNHFGSRTQRQLCDLFASSGRALILRIVNYVDFISPQDLQHNYYWMLELLSILSATRCKLIRARIGLLFYGICCVCLYARLTTARGTTGFIFGFHFVMQ